MLWIAVGGFFGVVLSYIVVLWKCYEACEMDEALVRSGQGGPRVAIQGGIWRFPLIHKFQKVTLRTLKLDVSVEDTERGMGVMRSKDLLPLVLDAEVYVHVPPREEYVIAAARTLGEKADPGGHRDSTVTDEETATEAIKEVTKEKLVSAIRGVAATMTLEELHGERLRFTESVQAALEQDLKENGLELETVTIESIDQEPISSVKSRAEGGSVLDEGAFTALNKKVQEAKTRQVEDNELNESLRDKRSKAERLVREQQDTEYRVGSLELEKTREFAVATQEREVSNKKVEEDATITTFEAETNRDKTVVVEESQLAAYSKIESAAQQLEVLQSDLENTKQHKIAENEEAYGTRQLERDQRLETKEESVKENIELAALQRVTNVGNRANECKEAVGVRKAQALGAIDVAGEDANLLVTTKEKEVADAKTYTHSAQAEAKRAEQSIETARIAEELRATTVVPAEAEKDAKILAAEGELRETELYADGERATANAKRDADLAKGSASSAVLALGQAEAESARLAAEAEFVSQEAAMLTDAPVVPYLMAKVAPALAGHVTDAVAAAFKPLENIDGMRILQVNTDGDGDSSGSPLNGILKNITNNAPAGAIINEMLDMAGSDLSVRQLIEKLVGGVAQASGLSAGLSSFGDSDDASS